MKFDYLQMADAMNVGPDGKVNVLGLGERLLVFPQLPMASRFAIVASLVGEPADAGTYEAEFRLETPDGVEQELFKTTIELAAPDDPDATLLVVGVGLDVVRPFTQEGRHLLRVKVGDQSAQYQFRIKVGQPSPTGSTAAASKASKPGPRSRVAVRAKEAVRP